jgi:dolichol-phosphate mannosyltransferase
MLSKLIIIPTLNEVDNIEKLIKELFSLKLDFSVLVVDDESTDGTQKAVERLTADFSDLFLLKRKGKKGLGKAYVDGFKWALKKNFDYIFQMDADFSHNPQDLEKLFLVCHKFNYDVAIGSRYVKGVNVVNWPMKRVLLSWFASKYVKHVTGMPIDDATAGFICYKRAVLEDLNIDKIKFVGYAFQIEMKYKIYLHNFKIKEVPVIFTDREKGKSKMSAKIIKEGILGVLKLRLNKLKFKK